MDDFKEINETAIYNLLKERIRAHVYVKIMPNDILYIDIKHDDFEVGYFFERDIYMYIMLGGSLERLVDVVTRKYKGEVQRKYFY